MATKLLHQKQMWCPSLTCSCPVLMAWEGPASFSKQLQSLWSSCKVWNKVLWTPIHKKFGISNFLLSPYIRYCWSMRAILFLVKCTLQYFAINVQAPLWMRQSPYFCQVVAWFMQGGNETCNWVKSLTQLMLSTTPSLDRPLWWSPLWPSWAPSLAERDKAFHLIPQPPGCYEDTCSDLQLFLCGDFI